MAGQIKGITIEFGANTTKLSAALKQIRNETTKTQTALREVDRALKFNPHNVELLTQKQRLLKQRVEEAANKVKELRDVQKQLDAKGVDKNSAEYQKLRREILVAENQLKHFNKEMIRFGNAKLNAIGGQITAIGNKLTTVNRRARQVLGAFTALALYKGFERLKTLDEVSVELNKLGYEGEKLQDAMDAATESVSGTKFALTDMAKVMKGALGSGVTDSYDLSEYLQRTADLAQLAGIDVQKMGAMMNKAYSKGRVDAKLLNQLNANGIPIYKLLQDELGVTSDKLSDMVRAGEVGFDDLYKATDKYKGLAQEMGTETFTGAFTVLTQQFGLIGADFLSGAYEPIKEGVKGIVAWLKELRADGTFKAWGQTVGDVIKYFATYLKDGTASMEGLSSGAEKAVQFLKPFIDFISQIVKVSMSLPTSIKQFGLFMALFGSPALKAIGATTQALGKFQKKAESVAESLESTGGLSKGQAVAGAFALIAINVGLAAAGIKDLIAGTNDYTRAYQKNADARQQSIDDVNVEYETAKLYADQLDALVGKEEKSAQDKALIKQYVDLLNGSVDGLNLSYDEQADKLNKSTDEIYKNIDAMKQQALQEAYTQATVEATKDLVKAEADLAEEQDHLAHLQKLYNDAVESGSPLAGQYGGEINKSKKKIEGYNKVINASRGEIDKYSKGFENASAKVSSETDKMTKSAKANMTKMSNAAKTAGSQFSTNIGSGIRSAKGKATSASKSVSDGVENSFDPKAYSLGAAWTRGVASGISGAISWVTSAVDKITNQIESKSKKNLEINSPSHVAARIGAGWDEGMALGMKRNLAMVRQASDIVSGTVIGGGAAITNETTNNKNLSANYTIIVNGGSDPEAYGRALARGLQQEMRTV